MVHRDIVVHSRHPPFACPICMFSMFLPLSYCVGGLIIHCTTELLRWLAQSATVVLKASRWPCSLYLELLPDLAEA
jgi:hypothetical protein